MADWSAPWGGALEARRVDAGRGRLTADVSGEVETEDGVLVLRRIHVAYRLLAPEEVRATVERVHGVHHPHCPVYRSLRAAIAITTSFELVDEPLQDGDAGG